MKKCLLACVLAVFTLAALGGCATNNIALDQQEMRVGASLATSATLLTVPVADRTVTAQAVYDGASAINTAATNGTVSLAALDELAQSQLAKWQSSYAPVVGAMVQVLESGIEAYLTNYLQGLPTTTQNQDMQLLAQAGAQGVMSACLYYTQGTPLPLAVARTSWPQKLGSKGDFTPIVIVPHVWTHPLPKP